MFLVFVRTHEALAFLKTYKLFSNVILSQELTFFYEILNVYLSMLGLFAL